MSKFRDHKYEPDSDEEMMSEAEFFVRYEAECQRKEKLLDQFEKLERAERRRKNPPKGAFRKKYERVTKGLFFVEKKAGDHIYLVSEDDQSLGILQVNSEVSQLLRIHDGLEGIFGLRDGYWRPQFISCIASSTEDFLDHPDESSNDDQELVH